MRENGWIDKQSMNQQHILNFLLTDLIETTETCCTKPVFRLIYNSILSW